MKNFVAVPATTYIPGFIARGSLISIFGVDFTDTTAIATTVPLPTELGGVTVTIGGEKAKLLYVSPGQINLQVPDALANMEQDTVIFSTRPYPQSIFGKISIFDTSPGLFSANSDGTGAAAASVIYVTGTTLRYDVAATCLPGQRCTTKPIDVRAADNVFLELYGSGIRYYHSLIQAEIAGIEAEVTYGGAHCCFVGVDQVNVKIPKILVARGEVDLRLIVDGNPANIIKIFLK